MKVWMLIFLIISFSAYSSEFSHIKLNPEFEQYLTQPKLKSNSIKRSTKAMSLPVAPPIQETMLRAVLGPAVLQMNDNTLPIDGEESPLYEEIRRHLEAAHQRIGLTEIQNINRINQQFNLGSSNFSGFSWQKPFGAVQVYADRQVTPNIFAQNWLVMDTFTFSIEATTFLEKLKEAGLTGMSAAEIGAFAGISFKRVYSNWHYANTYQEGLAADFSKLFLPFIKFNQNGMEKMANEEMMKREDVWTARTGGLITSPPVYNVSFSGGVLAEYDYQNVTTIEKNLRDEHLFKLGILAKKTITAGVSLEMQLDFFKLIKLSLLRYDMNYEYASGKEFTLGLKPQQWELVKNANEEGAEFRSLLKGVGTVKKLEPYVIRLDESSSSSISHKGSILIWGKLQKQKTEQIKVIKDNLVKTFYKNYAQNIKIVQNFFSRLFSAFIYKVLKFPVGATNAAVYSRQVTLEYEASHPQSEDPSILRVDSPEKFSFVLTQFYNASRTDRWIDKKFKNDLIWFVDNFTTLPKSYKTDIRNEVLKGPMLIESHLRVEKAGLQYFIDSPEPTIFSQLASVCGSNKNNLWTNEGRRKELLSSQLKGADACVKDLGNRYLLFKYDYTANQGKPSLAKFKSFVSQYYKIAENINSLQELFGVNNTFINGKLQAQTSMGSAFNTTFSSGQFRGLGVIDTFKRENGTRVPASIVSE